MSKTATQTPGQKISFSLKSRILPGNMELYNSKQDTNKIVSIKYFINRPPIR